MKILFVCTANSCRSILSEAIFNHLAPVGMRAFSAGSHPSGTVHPLSIVALQRAGISTEGLCSQGMDEHEALMPDFVVTVCDKAAGEACPLFFGSATKAHWGLEDPSEYRGSDEDLEAAFDATVARIKKRVAAFLALPVADHSAEQLQAELATIGSL